MLPDVVCDVTCGAAHCVSDIMCGTVCEVLFQDLPRSQHTLSCQAGVQQKALSAVLQIYLQSSQASMSVCTSYTFQLCC